MPRLLVLLTMCLPLAAQAGNVRIQMNGWRLADALRVLETRYVPVPRYHLTSEPAKKPDPCVFVSGIRHCPLPKLPNG